MVVVHHGEYLRSSWLVMHVSVIMVSYAALLVGSLLSLAVLVMDRGEALQLRSSSIGSGGFRQAVTTPDSGFLELQSLEISTNEQLGESMTKPLDETKSEYFRSILMKDMS